MKIEIGNKFKCIKSTTSDTSIRKPYFINGNIYKCEIRRCLTDESGYKKHLWSCGEEFLKHFIPYFENE